MNQIAFCTARVGEPVETPDGDDVNFIHTALPDTESVFNFLKDTYDRFVTLLADQNAELPEAERIDLSAIGGFGVQLTNRFGGEIEIGLGRQLCLLIRLNPEPTRIYRNPTPHEGTLVFYLDGWHYSEMEASELVAREDCLARLRAWLETNVFPGMA